MTWGWPSDVGYGVPTDPRRRGHQAYSLITAPTSEPITIDGAKRHLRLDTDDYNTEILTWIKAARQQVERDTERAILTQTVDVAVDEFPVGTEDIALLIAPIQSVTYIKYYDTSNTLQTWASTNYVLDAGSVPGRIGLAPSGTWPTGYRTFQPGVVRLIVGYTTSTNVPEPLLHAMRLLIGCFSRDKEPTPLERSTYDRLIDPYTVQTGV